jgi:D-sedoheptulose 7-phosphate isomerase
MLEQAVNDYLAGLFEALESLPPERLAEVGDTLFRAYCNDRQVFTLGNGGSSSTASHMAADLGKNTIGANMRRFRVMSLNDNTALMTALANDLGYESVFAEQLVNLIRPGDVLIVLSGSGNSPNVLAAMLHAREQCAEVIAFLGFDGGEAAKIADLSIIVPSSHYGVVEDSHLIINHILVDHFRARLAESQPSVVT